MIDLRQTKEWADWLAATGWKIEKVRAVDGPDLFAFVRPMPLLPISFLKLQRFEKQIDWKSFDQIKKKNHVLWSVVEPSDESLVGEIKDHGYRLTKETYTPPKTRVIDLTQMEEEISREMSENFRRIIKKLENSKTQELKAREIEAEEFYAGWKKWASSYILTRKQFDLLVKAFGNRAEFWAIDKNGELLSAIMLLFTADTCFYYQTWTSSEGRKSSEHVYLTWETIRRAKKLKKKFYNFEGVFDARFPMRKWGGFSEFKRRFGGYEVAYPGTFMKWF